MRAALEQARLGADDAKALRLLDERVKPDADVVAQRFECAVGQWHGHTATEHRIVGQRDAGGAGADEVGAVHLGQHCRRAQPAGLARTAVDLHQDGLEHG